MIRKRPDFLEGFRGVAAWFVVFHHIVLALFPVLWLAPYQEVLAWSPAAAYLKFSPLGLVFNGSAAVAAFFVHSGFVLSFRFFNEDRSHAYVVASAVRRYFRLFLPAMASILIAWALMSLRLVHSGQVVDLTGSVWISKNMTFQPDFFGAWKQGAYDIMFQRPLKIGMMYNAPLWTIGTEFIGSLLVFAFLALFGAVRTRWLAYAAACILFHDGYYIDFFVGVVLCDLYTAFGRSFQQSRRQPSVALVRVGRVIALALGLYLASYPGADSPLYQSLWSLFADSATSQLQAVGAAFLITALLLSHPTQVTMERPFFRRLGEISYSVYLVHTAVLTTIGCGIIEYLMPTYSLTATAIIVFPSCVLVTLGASFLMRKYIDKPAIAFSHWLYRRWAAPLPRPDHREETAPPPPMDETRLSA